MLTQAEKEERHFLNAVIVDENLQDREAARRALAAEGYTGVCVSPDELFAPPASSDSTTDICVPDAALFLVALRSGSGRGIEIVRWLKRCERWRRVPIVAVNDPETPGEATADLPGDVTVADGISAGVRSALELLSTASVPQHRASITVTLSLQDTLAREVSRARRTGFPLSVMLGRFYVCSGGALSSEDEAPGQDWMLRLKDAVCRALRETDTVICLDAAGTLLLVLPLTGQDGLGAVETRFHDCARPILRQYKSQTGRAMKFVVAFSQFPHEAWDWRSLLASAQSRLEMHLQQEMLPAKDAAA